MIIKMKKIKTLKDYTHGENENGFNQEMLFKDIETKNLKPIKEYYFDYWYYIKKSLE